MRMHIEIFSLLRSDYLVMIGGQLHWLVFPVKQRFNSCFCFLNWKHGSLDWCSLNQQVFLSNVQLYSPLLSSGAAAMWGSFTLSSLPGEEVRWSSLAGVLALLGRAFGVDGLPRVDGGLGEAAGLGELALPLVVAGDDGRCLDKGLGLEGCRLVSLSFTWNVCQWRSSPISLTSTCVSSR